MDFPTDIQPIDTVEGRLAALLARDSHELLVQPKIGNDLHVVSREDQDKVVNALRCFVEPKIIDANVITEVAKKAYGELLGSMAGKGPIDQEGVINTVSAAIIDAAMRCFGPFPIWRHRKRGTAYYELGRAALQLTETTPLKNGEKLVIYQGADGRVWARPEPEFMDGRFEKVEEVSNDGV